MNYSMQQLELVRMQTETRTAPPVTARIRANDARGTAASAFAWKEFTF